MQGFSQGHVTHPLRANYESGSWPREFDNTLVEGLAQVLGSPLGLTQRAQVFLRLADGGLGFSSAEQATEAAFLGSLALTLKEVAACLGVSTWAGFRDRCGPLAERLQAGETTLVQDSGGKLQQVDWVGLLVGPRGKLQSF